jgi:hypothetical protein
MMADIILKLRRSSATGSIFADRVTGVAAPQRAYDYAALAYPAAFVALLSEDAEAQPPGSNENTQRVAQIWGIVVALNATDDIRGQEPSQSIEVIRRAVMRAIYNWSPHSTIANLWYDGCELLAVNRAVAFWVLRFGTYFWLCGEDGVGETEEQFDPLPWFLRIHYNFDWISPHDPGLPPSEIYDVKFGPPPWRSGPEGRVEMHAEDQLPPQPPRRVQ